MTDYLFPDNTVLCNFAAVHQLPLLEKLLDGNGRWAEAVEQEATKSAAYYPDLSSISAKGWLGTPLEIDDEIELRQVEGLRRAVFGGSASRPLEHLGEAQTIHIVTRWSSFSGSTWLSDDQDSLRYARQQGIAVRETQHLVAEAVQWGWIGSAAAGYAMIEQMRASGQRPALPPSASSLNSM